MRKYANIYKNLQKSKPQCNMVSIFLLAKFLPSTVPSPSLVRCRLRAAASLTDRNFFSELIESTARCPRSGDSLCSCVETFESVLHGVLGFVQAMLRDGSDIVRSV